MTTASSHINQSLSACKREPFTLVSPVQNETVTQHTKEQDAFIRLLLDVHSFQSQSEWLEIRRKKQADLSLPKINVFRWRCLDDMEAQLVEVSENSDFKGHVFHFPVEPGKNEAMVHSLKSDTTYYWRVIGKDCQARTVYSSLSRFRTADEIPRWVWVDGVSNVRDMGGWKTEDGHHVRQGLIFRGGEMQCHMTVTEAGLHFVEYELGLRSLLDLRGQDELDTDPTHGSSLSPCVHWYNTPIGGYANCATDENKSQYAKAFRICLDLTNLPLYTHCWGGADRTGTLIFLLNAALGVSETDLILDYELTSLAIWGVRSYETELFSGFLDYLESIAPEQDIQTKAITYWKSIGITDNEISQFQKLFLCL